MIPTNIPLTFRVDKGAPLTPVEVDDDLRGLRLAILALAEEFQDSHLVIGAEPVAGERDGVVWVPTDLSGIFSWNSTSSTWVSLAPESVINVTDTGSGENYVIQLTDSTASYAALEGRLIVMRAIHVSTGASKIKVKNSAGVLFDSSGLDLVNHSLGAITANDIKVGQKVIIVYNSGQFQMLSPVQPVVSTDVRNVFTYQSTLIALPATGGKLTFTHGLKYLGNDITPSFVRGVLRRKTSPFTHVSGKIYAVGEEIDVTPLWSYERGSENERFHPVVRPSVTDTTIEFQFYYPYGIGLSWGFLGGNKNAHTVAMGGISTGGSDSTDGSYTDWEFKCYALAFNPDQLGSSLDSISSGGGTTAPVITVQPTDEAGSVAGTATFSVEGTDINSVTWLFDHATASGGRFAQTDTPTGDDMVSSLVISALALGDSLKKVQALVSGPGGSLLSTEVTLTVT